MMFQCYICKRQISQDVELIKHLRTVHALCEGSTLTLCCCVSNCVSTFKTFSGFRKHIKKCSLKNTTSYGGPLNSQVNVNKISEQCNLSDTVASDGKDIFEHSIKNTFEQVTSSDKLVESYMSKLYALGIPESTIQLIINCTSELIETLFETKPQCPEEFKNLFQNYRSKHMRDSHFKNLVVKPVEVPIGLRFDQKWNKTTKQYNQVPITCSYTYIPIFETLKFLFKNQSFLSFITKDAVQPASSIISNYSQGLNFRNNILFLENQPCLQIQLYFDEFETVNPLGSKTGGHKLGAVYFIIRNLPSYFNSVPQNIHLLALFYSADVKVFGFNKILDKILSDVKQLETVGIFVETLQKHIKGTIVAISHDNLGGNQIFGLVESFSSKYYCRICLADKNTTRTMCKQDDSKLRTTAHYEQLCLKIENENSNLFGIKYRSILNDLTYFKIFENLSADVMHDILEGIGPFEIKLFLKYVVKEKILTLDEINNRLKSFNFGYNEMCNKPSPINLDKTGNLIGERAGQTWCLLRFLPLILGDVVATLSNKQAEKFKVLTLLLDIMDIVFCPVITYGMVSQLTELISTHHRLFQVEFDCHLTPKHHFMVHYPTIILSSGPLVALWCMRFESKHAYFKDLCYKLKNFKSLSKTLAFRHQKYMWNEWQNMDLSTRPIYDGKCTMLPINKIDCRYHAFLTTVFDCTVELLTTKSVKFLGSTFKSGTFIVNEISDDALPIFLQVKYLIINNDLPYALCVIWKTIEFHERYHAYIIEEITNAEYAAVNICSLKHVYAYEQHRPFNSNLNCIVLKYEIVL